MAISTDGQLTEHINEPNTRWDIINREICKIGAKAKLGKAEVIVKLKLFETWLMPAQLTCMGWNPRKLLKTEIQHPEKIQGEALKGIFNLPIATPHIGLKIETGV